MSDADTTRDDAGAQGCDPLDACSLPADGLADRLAWIRREILPHAVAEERSGDILVLELDEAPGLRGRLDQLVALERECCSGIGFEAGPGPVPGRLRLTIRGIDPDAPVFRGLRVPPEQKSSPAGEVQQGQTSSPAGRLAKAAGLGVVASLVVCCLVPIGAGALLGAAAAPLSGLDAPGPIAAGALLGGVGAWWWLGRPGRRSDLDACGRDC